MTPTTITSRVGADGVLSVVLPLGPSEANQEVRVTVEAISSKPAMTQEAWAAWVKSMEGSIDDPSFRRHEQGDFEQRDPLE